MLYLKTDKCVLYHDDNINVLHKMPSNKVNLIYCDVLYNTKSKFNDYKDDLGTPKEAVEWYRPRFIEMHRILAENGSLYIHCDWHLNSYLRVLLDEIFGYECFKNEIIRQCTNAKNNSNGWGRIYDNILYYVKDPENYIWNEAKEPKIESDLLAQYNKVTKDGGRRYTTIPLHAKGVTKNGETGRDWHSKTHGVIKLPDGRHWATSHSAMDELDSNGSIEWSKNNVPRKILYADEYGDKHIQNIWDIKSISGDSNISYDTQKPIELLDRIIRASSNEGHLVCDFFMGSGVTALVSKSLNRKFVGCDINIKSLELTKKYYE
jgi:DNA modification methylase